MNFKFSCPQCGQKIAAAAESMATHVDCPTCSSPILVPTIKLESVNIYRPQPTRFSTTLTIVITALCSVLATYAGQWSYRHITSDHQVVGASPQKLISIDSGAMTTLKQYLSATKWEDRLQVVKNPEQVRQWMKEYYKDYTGPVPITSIIQRTDLTLPSEYVAYEVRSPNFATQIYGGENLTVASEQIKGEVWGCFPRPSSTFAGAAAASIFARTATPRTGIKEPSA